jgi:universal stress protein A
MILCAIDFSVVSRHAARVATDISRAIGARIGFVHVVFGAEWPVATEPELALSQPLPVDELSRDAREALARLARDFCVEADVHIVFGAAAREIVKLADELDAGMIVMGTHGRTGFAHLLLGSVAERVIRASHVPVLIVPTSRSAQAR